MNHWLLIQVIHNTKAYAKSNLGIVDFITAKRLNDLPESPFQQNVIKAKKRRLHVFRATIEWLA